jgi:AMP-polyphosphate phosphotransferase
VLLKFWLHVSPKEQLERFEARRGNPLKDWKLTDEDWRNRDKRAAYEEAVEEMLDQTDVPDAPWILVEGDSKRWARIRVMDETISAIEAGMRRVGLAVPEPL